MIKTLKEIWNNIEPKEREYLKVGLYFIILVGFIAIIILPWALTREFWSFIDYKQTGAIGDTINGIAGPFITLTAAILTFFAFYMQVKANKMVQSQFERNKFENQFFEMLKIHKENSNIINSTHQESEVGIGFADEQAHLHWLETREKEKGFIFLVKRINKKYNKKKNENKSIDKYIDFNSVYSNLWEDSFGHYFRHLFLIVKFVVSKQESFLTYEEKREYLRILRASLSTYEQVFLYYNWLSDYGKQWENDKNHFFTDYRMIHNINPAIILNDFSITEIHPFSNFLKDKKYRKEENKTDDTLFELIPETE